MNPIRVMISSTVEDLKRERETAEQAFRGNSFVELIGADRFNAASLSGNSRLETQRMARECDLYILILGATYGAEIETIGKSATEIEFDAAIQSDPTKILIFKKETELVPEEKQQAFINRVSHYFSGYWRTSFSHTAQLLGFVQNSFQVWLKNRAQFDQNVDYVDHFIRLAKERKPEASARVYYKVDSEKVDLSYEFFSGMHTMIFERKSIFRDFWGSLNQLENRFHKWLSE